MHRNMLKRNILISCALMAASLMLFAACSSSSEGEPVDETINIHGLLAQTTEDQLFQQSSLLIIGKVKDEGNSFRLRSYSKNEANYTDYNIDVSETLRGSLDGQSVTVRIPGGTAGRVKEIVSPSPRLEQGGEYLMFLYKPARGGAFNAEGDYYYILGLTQGIFQKIPAADKDVKMTTPTYKSQSGSEITFERILERADEYPIDEDFFRKQYIKNQQLNLESGFITKAEFDDAMANIDTYAKVIADR